MKISLVLVAMLLAGCQAVPQSSDLGTVIRVTSGQTIEVRLNSQIQKVGLLGVEAPDYRQQPWANQAKQRLQQLIAGKSVCLEFSSPESADYRLASVWLDREALPGRTRTLLNEQLIQEGLVMARSRTLSPYQNRLSYAQEQARILGLGIWNPTQPMRQTPTQFRAQL
ncbi:MAG: thermonuclease family protein [Microcoleus sp. SIO2G3]|nr:thermonuclease family protein [Microcoleus sp. SIO2G3]